MTFMTLMSLKIYQDIYVIFRDPFEGNDTRHQKVVSKTFCLHSAVKKRIRRPVQSVQRLRIPRIKAEIYDKNNSIKRSINNRAYVAILSLAASTFYVIGVAISWDQQITVLDFFVCCSLLSQIHLVSQWQTVVYDKTSILGAFIYTFSFSFLFQLNHISILPSKFI